MTWLLKNDNEKYCFEVNDEEQVHNLKCGFKLLIDGYVIPRINIYNEYRLLSQSELIDSLIQKYSLNFIDHIKGVFNLILLKEDTFYIFNDRHSIKKFFIYQEKSNWFISNQLREISKIVELSISKNNAAMFCIMEHFVEGFTLFNNLIYSQAATKLSFNKNIELSYYWKPELLLELPLKDYSYDFLVDYWRKMISNYIEYLKPKDITMTLTGGNDSRMIFAALLNLGVTFNTFTFGNPHSSDSIVAKELADKQGINFNNYFVEYPTKEWFSEYSNKIIEFGNSFINIHRAHRLDAVENEISKNPDVEMIFGGFMGGDYLKGIIYDDYITSESINLFENSSLSNDEIIKKMLIKNNLHFSEKEISGLKEKFENLPFVNNQSKIFRQFLYVYKVIGCVHDVQDINIFSSKIKFVVNPYMDVDFLSIIFQTKHCMLYKKNDKKTVKKLMQSILHVKITDILAPKISNIRYAKKGYYTAEEFLGNKIVYLIKRVIRFKLEQRKKAPSNFPYSEWALGFCNDEMKKYNRDLKEIINIERYDNSLKNDNHLTTEGYYHRFTNLININLNYNKFSEEE